MRRYLIRLAIALVAFIIGVTAATVLGRFSGLRAQHRCLDRDRDAYVAPPMPAQQHSCRMRLDAHVIPEPPAVPAPPAVPEPPKTVKVMRIHVHAADGTVKDVEIKTDKDAEQ